MSVGYDATFELNEFGQAKLKSEVETVRDVILFILYTKPGDYPSLPTIGLDIESIIGTFYDELDIDDLKRRLIDQCSELNAYISNGVINITKSVYRGVPTVLIYIKGTAVYSTDYLSTSTTGESGYIIGLQLDDIGHLTTDIQEYSL